MLVARISLTLSRHFSLSFIASGRSSGLHPVSSHSCEMYVRDGRPAFVRPYVGVHKSTSLMSSSLLLQQCPACLVRLTWIVFVIGCRWPYSWCLVGCWGSMFVCVRVCVCVCVCVCVWKYLWCIRYRHSKWIRRLEFKSRSKRLEFHLVLITLGKLWTNNSSSYAWVNSKVDWLFNLCIKIGQREEITMNSNLINFV